MSLERGVGVESVAWERVIWELEAVALAESSTEKYMRSPAAMPRDWRVPAPSDWRSSFRLRERRNAAGNGELGRV